MARLRQLELDPNKAEGTLELSQKQYVERIETLHANLHTAWNKDEKVRAWEHGSKELLQGPSGGTWNSRSLQ